MVDVSDRVGRWGVMMLRWRSDVSELVGCYVFARTRRAKWKRWLVVEDVVLIGWRLEQEEKANVHTRKREKHVTVS